jgi:hypothetical protein
MDSSIRTLRLLHFGDSFRLKNRLRLRFCFLCELRQRHLDLRLLAQHGEEADRRGVVSSCSARGRACCYGVCFQELQNSTSLGD